MDDREASLKALDEIIELPDLKTVRPGSQAERLCKRLISVVMCTFAIDPAHAIIMRGFCDFPERERIKPSQLAKKMKIDQKTVSTTLKQLKAGGYILETSFCESFNKKARASHLKSVRYHIDYSFFINMIRLRLHEIVLRLSAKQEKNDEKCAIGTFWCINELCKEYNHPFNTLDLMMNKNNNSKEIVLDNGKKKQIFICDMCHEKLYDESEVLNKNKEDNLDIKRKFNQQSLPLTKLLNIVENELKKEREFMITEQKRAIEEKDNIEQGIGELSYKAANLNFGKKHKRGIKVDENEMTLNHLSRLNGRKRTIDTSKFEFKPEELNDKKTKKKSNKNIDNANNEDENKENVDNESDIATSEEDQDIDILPQNWMDSTAILSNENGNNIKLNNVEMKKAIEKNFEKMKTDGEKHFQMLEKESSIDLNLTKKNYKNNNSNDTTNGNINGNTNNNDNNNNNSNTSQVNGKTVNGRDFFDAIKKLDTSKIMIKVNGQEYTLKTILSNPTKYESDMTDDEYIDYDTKICQLGITSID